MGMQSIFTIKIITTLQENSLKHPLSFYPSKNLSMKCRSMWLNSQVVLQENNSVYSILSWNRNNFTISTTQWLLPFFISNCQHICISVAIINLRYVYVGKNLINLNKITDSNFSAAAVNLLSNKQLNTKMAIIFLPRNCHFTFYLKTVPL